jgi:hypothetical protein
MLRAITGKPQANASRIVIGEHSYHVEGKIMIRASFISAAIRS